MEAFEFYVFNQTRNAWLQDDEKSWGDFTGAQAFTDAQLAEDIRERETKGDDTTYTFGFMQ